MYYFIFTVIIFTEVSCWNYFSKSLFRINFDSLNIA